MENTETLNIRISKELKQTLEKQAQQRGQTISDYVRELLTRRVTQDADYIFGISPDVLERIRAEAARRNIPMQQLTRTLLMWAFEHLRKDTGRLIIFD